MKKIWMTALDDSKETAQKFMAAIKPYGLEMEGHFWKDDLMKWAWAGPQSVLRDPEIAVWVLLSTKERLSTPDTAYGLSLLCLSTQAKRGLGFPVIIVQTDDQPLILTDELPTALKGAEIFSLKNPGLGPKLTAKVHTPVKSVPAEYSVDIQGNEHLGQWFEIGPVNGSWKGAIFGVSGAEILFHAVGQKGALPKTAELNYALRGMKVNLGEKAYMAWAVQNDIDSNTSYFVKVMGYPDSILFGAYSDGESAELYVIRLK